MQPIRSTTASVPRRRSRVRTQAALAAVALGAAITTIPVTASPAAATTLVLCTGSDQAGYSPGLTTSPQNVTLTASDTYPGCGSSQTSGQLTGASCAGITTPSFSETVNWSFGTAPNQSVIAYSAVDASVRLPVGTVVTVSGTVTSGRYSGATATKQVLIVNDGNLLACLTPTGLTSAAGPATLTIVQP